MNLPLLFLAAAAFAVETPGPLSATDSAGKTLALAVVAPASAQSLYPFLSFTRVKDGVAVACDEAANGMLGCHWINRSRLTLAVKWADVEAAAKSQASGRTLVVKGVGDSLGGSWALRVTPGAKSGQVKGAADSTAAEPVTYAYLIELERAGGQSWLPLNKDQTELTLQQIRSIRDARQARRRRQLEGVEKGLEKRFNANGGLP